MTQDEAERQLLQNPYYLTKELHKARDGAVMFCILSIVELVVIILLLIFR